MSLLLDESAQDLLFRQARTANTFTDEPVSDDQIQAIYDLVKFAPTSLNMQPLRIVLVRSPQARERLVSHMGEGNKPKTASAPLTAILAADTHFHDEFHRTFPHVPGVRDWFTGDDHARAETAKFNGALQVGYFILGVRAAGLYAGPMTGYDKAGINKEFFPDGEHEVLAVVNIGKPGENAWFARSPRLEYDDVVSTI
ncbi:putative NADH dehydrogenase/NAD(P)H nitroreductase [Rhizocola hellebori]|uniref:Putative NADH dehydrogenase/NAD(P)H nitroreductase n=1 Tax=Rhizocola hellebori TaxID=1392758 RepID=A0A8J3Q5Q8_9ACTN|nr:malonic semialdehyde reductase [Rhizocola hellebori]GIH04335.1 putative NADH dehydrogenase/NAD(P)H nitroreductase [Rhizocola hellebori]